MTTPPLVLLLLDGAVVATTAETGVEVGAGAATDVFVFTGILGATAAGVGAVVVAVAAATAPAVAVVEPPPRSFMSIVELNPEMEAVVGAAVEVVVDGCCCDMRMSPPFPARGAVVELILLPSSEPATPLIDMNSPDSSPTPALPSTTALGTVPVPVMMASSSSMSPPAAATCSTRS